MEKKMKSFIGTKLIKAKPMNRKDYNDLRGWTVPSDENPADEGYLVEYQNQTPNVKGFNGYVSWSPKSIFEKNYLELITNPELKTDKPSISQEMVDNFIVKVDTSTLQNKTTIVIATLANGFTIVESSTCVSPENYSEAMGRDICLKRIKEKIWPYLGFMLQSAVTPLNTPKI
ncbi:MAG: Gp49 family protein [Pleomorphochaeta sp.]